PSAASSTPSTKPSARTWRRPPPDEVSATVEAEREPWSLAPRLQARRLGAALERGELGCGQKRRRAADLVEDAVVEQHHAEGEERLVLGEVAVLEAIDRDREVSREQRPGEQRLQVVEVFVEVRH